ncbi:hypothetical protein BJ138DRAFT_1106157, partial [Hygrophoropsis aurantiaca]
PASGSLLEDKDDLPAPRNTPDDDSSSSGEDVTQDCPAATPTPVNDGPPARNSWPIKKGPMTKEGISRCVEFGERVMQEAEEIARELGKPAKENMWNHFHSCYSYNYEKHPDTSPKDWNATILEAYKAWQEKFNDAEPTQQLQLEVDLDVCANDDADARDSNRVLLALQRKAITRIMLRKLKVFLPNQQHFHWMRWANTAAKHFLRLFNWPPGVNPPHGKDFDLKKMSTSQLQALISAYWPNTTDGTQSHPEVGIERWTEEEIAMADTDPAKTRIALVVTPNGAALLTLEASTNWVARARKKGSRKGKQKALPSDDELPTEDPDNELEDDPDNGIDVNAGLFSDAANQNNPTLLSPPLDPLPSPPAPAPSPPPVHQPMHSANPHDNKCAVHGQRDPTIPPAGRKRATDDSVPDTVTAPVVVVFDLAYWLVPQ